MLLIRDLAGSIDTDRLSCAYDFRLKFHRERAIGIARSGRKNVLMSLTVLRVIILYTLAPVKGDVELRLKIFFRQTCSYNSLYTIRP